MLLQGHTGDGGQHRDVPVLAVQAGEGTEGPDGVHETDAVRVAALLGLEGSELQLGEPGEGAENVA
jgi:hypothetical protein